MSYPVLCGAVVLTSANNAIRFTEGATTATTTIPAGTYYLRGGYTTNLVPRSSDFVTSWFVGGTAAITAGATQAPSGGLAYRLENTSSGFAAVYSDFFSFSGSGTKIVSFFAKAGTASIFDFSLYDATALTPRHVIRITWDANGAPTLETSFGNGSIRSTYHGNGWYRISFTALNVISSNNNQIYIYPEAYKSVFIWGVQAENARNLIPSPIDLTAASWRTDGTAITITSTAVAAPDGVTGYNSNLTSTTAAVNYIVAASNFSENGPKVFSFYARANTATQSAVLMYDGTIGVDRTQVNITWSGGVPTATVTGGTVSVISVGNSWYLFTATSPSIVASSINDLYVYPAGRTTAAGSTLFWGLQTYNAIVPGLYVPTTGASATGPSDELSLAVKTALEAATASTNTYDVTVSRNISPSSAHTRTTITRLTGSDSFGALWADALTTFDERLLGFSGSDVVSSTPKQSTQACAANWVGNDIPREMEPVSERVVAVPRAASGRVQGVSRSARMQSWRMGLAFIDERRMLVDRALSVPGDTLEGFLERFGANAALEAWEAFIDTGTGLLPLSLANLWSVMHFSEDTLSGFAPTRLGPGVPLYSIDLRLHGKV